MKYNKRIQHIMQTALLVFTIFTTLMFYEYNSMNLLLRKFIVTFLIVANCAYSCHVGLEDRTDVLNEVSEKLIGLNNQLGSLNETITRTDKGKE